LAKQKKKFEKNANEAAKKLRAEDSKAAKKRKAKESDSDDDTPLAKAKSKKPIPKKATNGVKTTPSSSKSKTKTEASPAKKVKTEEDEDADEEEDEYRWWEAPDADDKSIKWTTLQHNGVLFPPEYEPLPAHVKLIYDGIPVSLAVEAEEVAGFYGSMLNSTVNVENKTFNENFFKDFKAILDKTGHGKEKDGKTVKITSFDKCKFDKIFEYYESERNRKKNASKEEKQKLKEEKLKAEEPFQFCHWNGRKEKVGNFRVEPPGLFRGRGAHPKTGKVKLRVKPEQITINIGKGTKIPQPPPGHKWKEVKHDQTGTWLAMWQENINSAYKYVMLAANSTIKGKSDLAKFEKARELKKHIDRIRKDYEKDLKSGLNADRQRATAIYLIDKFALRAGNEKGEDEADTVGCCSLKFEHVELRPPNTVIFDFLGKDSIRFHDEVAVDPQVFKNLRIFKKAPKKEGDDIFDRLTTSALNKHLNSYMPGLTAKVFRTYNASWTMASVLKEMEEKGLLKGTVAEKVKAYNDANRRVAILCNHKRTVAASHETQIEKLNEKIKGLKYQQWRIRMMMLDIEPKLKKKNGADYFLLPDELKTDELSKEQWVGQHQASEVEEKRQKIQKKFEKDNEKLKAEGKKEMPEKELKSRLEEADELAKKYAKENKTGKVIAEGKGPSVEKLQANYDKISERIQTMTVQKDDKDSNKEVALGTSKIVSSMTAHTREETNFCVELY
jgi:DNA topoisomerase I